MIRNTVIILLLLFVFYQFTSDCPSTECDCEDTFNTSTSAKCEVEQENQKPANTLKQLNRQDATPKSQGAQPTTMTNTDPSANQQQLLSEVPDKFNSNDIEQEIKTTQENIDPYEETSYLESAIHSQKKFVWQDRINGSYAGFINFRSSAIRKRVHVILKIHFPPKARRRKFSGNARVFHYIKNSLVRIEIAPNSVKLNKNNALIIKLPRSTFQRSNVKFNSGYIRLSKKFYFKTRYFIGTAQSCTTSCLNVGNFRFKAL